MKKLYKITNGIGEYWVIAEDPKQAEDKLFEYLNKEDYGFSKDRVMKSLEVIATAKSDKSILSSHKLLP